MNLEDKIAASAAKHDILLVVLFGSQAEGKVHPGSDIDIAVKTRRGAEVSKLELIFELGGIFGDREIDLVLLTEQTDPLLLQEIFAKGKLLYEAAPGMFEEERLRAWKLYLDTEPLRRRLEAFLKESGKGLHNVA